MVNQSDNDKNNVFDIFKMRLHSFSKNIALQVGSRNYSYDEVLNLANEVGVFLKKQGGNVDYPIVIALARSAELVIIFIACILNKIPFLLLNTNLPALKKERIEKLANPFLRIVSEGPIENTFKKSELHFSVQRNPHFHSENKLKYITEANDHICYLATSSGSTGEIKCVAIGAMGLLKLMQNQSDYFQLLPQQCVLQIANPSFDAIILEIFVSLWSGAILKVMTVNDSLLISEIIKVIDTGTIEFILLTPSVAQKIPPSVLCKLKTLVVGGEAPSLKLIKQLVGKIRIINAFGPCETTVCTHMCDITENKLSHCIGHPMLHINARVVDEMGKDVKQNGVGELWIYGEAVGYGYLGRPDDPAFGYDDVLKMRFYKTKDKVKIGKNNALYFICRTDNMVKVRGQQVNLNELADIAMQYSGIENAQAFYLKQEEKVVLLLQGNFIKADFNSYLKLHVPEVAIPKEIIQITLFPISNNGKKDVMALHQIAVDYITEKKLAIQNNQSNHKNILYSQQDRGMRALQDILETPDLNLEDNFFDAGGDSLKMIDLMTQFNEITGKDMDLAKFLKHPILSHFINLLEDDAHFTDPLSQLDHELASIKTWPPKNKGMTGISKNILMTGATGRVGQSILTKLLEDKNNYIICLGRGSVEKIKHFIKKRGIHLSDIETRLHWIPCDFSKMQSIQDAFKELEKINNIGSIIHCGAQVNHIYDFNALYQTNVHITYKLLELAYHQSIPRFIYISSTSAISPKTSNGNMRFGYNLTKGASEELVKLARSCGLDATILKLPLVYDLNFSSIEMLKKDHFFCKIWQCLHMEAIPQGTDYISALSAEDCAQIISCMCFHPNPLKEEFVFMADDPFSWQALVKSFRPTSRELSYDAWIHTLFNQADHDPMPLSPFLSLYKENAPFNRHALPQTAHLETGHAAFLHFIHTAGITLMNTHTVLSTLFSATPLIQQSRL